MIPKRRPDGRESVLAGAALEALTAREREEDEMARLAALSPRVDAWRDNRRNAIRLIDLERRAQFSRICFETN